LLGPVFPLPPRCFQDSSAHAFPRQAPPFCVFWSSFHTTPSLITVDGSFGSIRPHVIAPPSFKTFFFLHSSLGATFCAVSQGTRSDPFSPIPAQVFMPDYKITPLFQLFSHSFPHPTFRSHFPSFLFLRSRDTLHQKVFSQGFPGVPLTPPGPRPCLSVHKMSSDLRRPRTFGRGFFTLDLRSSFLPSDFDFGHSALLLFFLKLRSDLAIHPGPHSSPFFFLSCPSAPLPPPPCPFEVLCFVNSSLFRNSRRTSVLSGSPPSSLRRVSYLLAHFFHDHFCLRFTVDERAGAV